MLLAIDSGNTNIVFAVFDDGGGLRGQWRSSTDTDRTADEFGVWLTQLFRLDGLERDGITAAIVATVVPATLFNLKTLCRKYFGCDPLVIGDQGVKLGLDIRVDRPEEVGADRLVNAVAAHEAHGGPLIIVDFGTATTFDVIDAEGAYCGGVIAPGVNLSLEALHMAAAKLPRVAIGRPHQVIGKGTVEAMKSSKPVLTTTGSGGVLEFVEDGRTGFVTPSGDSGALAQRIDELYADRALAERMGTEGLSRVAAINWDHVVTRLLEV